MKLIKLFIIGFYFFILCTITLPIFAGQYSVAGADDDALIESSAKDFCAAVKNGDKNKVATFFDFPVRVNLADGKTMQVANANALLNNYDKIFTKTMIAAISNASTTNMFARDQGIMLGDGEVWFGPEGKVISLNVLK